MSDLPYFHVCDMHPRCLNHFFRQHGGILVARHLHPDCTRASRRPDYSLLTPPPPVLDGKLHTYLGRYLLKTGEIRQIANKNRQSPQNRITRLWMRL